MSIEEIIEALEMIYDDCVVRGECFKTIREAIEKLKTHPEAKPNEPLTIDDLAGMHGEAVWVVELNDYPPHWALVYWSGKRHKTYLTLDNAAMLDAATFIAAGGRIYRCPPKEEMP